MSYGRFTRLMLISLSLCLGSTSTIVLAEPASQLELKAYLNEPGGPQIAEGLYSEAAERIERRLGSLHSLDKLVAYNNLCVAKTMLREFESAEHACDSAVRRARQFEIRSRSLKDRPSATALNNRAVLRIILGNVEEATVDLERASSRDRDRGSTLARNLAYIGQLPAQSFADAD